MRTTATAAADETRRVALQRHALAAITAQYIRELTQPDQAAAA